MNGRTHPRPHGLGIGKDTTAAAFVDELSDLSALIMDCPEELQQRHVPAASKIHLCSGYFSGCAGRSDSLPSKS